MYLTARFGFLHAVFLPSCDPLTHMSVERISSDHTIQQIGILSVTWSMIDSGRVVIDLRLFSRGVLQCATFRFSQVPNISSGSSLG